MKIPNILELTGNNAQILRETLQAVKPDEGCALVIGNQSISNNFKDRVCLQIHLIWPCCNVWVPNQIDEGLNINSQKKSHFSKRNRFQIDPKEQIAAQKWSRLRELQVLGSAHSHPTELAMPSAIDLQWIFHPQLMIIVDKYNQIRAWWITNSENYQEIDVAFRMTKNKK
tara:strand:+ start:171 stop:680 length:510 start_codon:yes stop_codon:yes gene_type:complete